jgi:hypothetical protein
MNRTLKSTKILAHDDMHERNGCLLGFIYTNNVGAVATKYNIEELTIRAFPSSLRMLKVAIMNVNKPYI